MTDPVKPANPAYPAHDWGKLAEDPWLPIGSDSEEHRQVLRRIWLRNGGAADVFEQLSPPVKADKRRPTQVK